MKRVITFIFLTFFPGMAFCNISLYPFYLSFDADSSKRSAQMRFTNTSTEKKSYVVELVNYVQQKDGSYKPVAVKSGGLFADKYLDYSPHSVTLDPGKSQVVRLKRKGMAAASDGEYVSHLMVRELEGKKAKPTKKASGISVDIKPLYGITIPVIIDKGNLNSAGAIESHKTLGNVQEVVVTRTGDRSFFGTVIVKEHGKEIGKVSKFRIFTDTPERVLKVPLNRTPSGSVSITLIDEDADEDEKSSDL